MAAEKNFDGSRNSAGWAAFYSLGSIVFVKVTFSFEDLSSGIRLRWRGLEFESFLFSLFLRLCDAYIEVFLSGGVSQKNRRKFALLLPASPF